MLNTCKSNASLGTSGERVSNAQTIYPWVWDNLGILGLIPDVTTSTPVDEVKDLLPREESVSYQLVGGVTAHQGIDG